jgi:hypothetical protein
MDSHHSVDHHAASVELFHRPSNAECDTVANDKERRRRLCGLLLNITDTSAYRIGHHCDGLTDVVAAVISLREQSPVHIALYRGLDTHAPNINVNRHAAGDGNGHFDTDCISERKTSHHGKEFAND